MKTKRPLLRTGLVGLFLIAVATVNGQITAPVPTLPIVDASDLHIGTVDDGNGAFTAMNTAVFFYRPDGTGALTLQASLTDDSTPAISFSSYMWYEVTTTNGTDEVPTLIDGEITRDLALGSADLQPGYHKYRVYGVVEENGTECQSDEFQDIVFFVLRPLDPTASVATDAISGFCVATPPTDPLLLTAAVAFDDPAYYGGYPNPDVEDFTLSYSWYAVKDGDTENPIALPTATGTASGATNTLSITDYSALDVVGTYTFYVEVVYSNDIKDRGTRTHAIWKADVMKDGSTYELTVTPVPGRPTITIVESSIVD